MCCLHPAQTLHVPQTLVASVFQQQQKSSSRADISAAGVVVPAGQR
jgi:hypothetical protein